MKVLITTHAQMFQAPDNSIWTDSIYGYDFFQRYLDVFEKVRVLSRVKKITLEETKRKLRVDGEHVEVYALPFYRGPWEFAMKYYRIRLSFNEAIKGCDRAILRVPDQISFNLVPVIQRKKIPFGVEVVAHPWDLYAPRNINTILRPALRIIWDRRLKKVCKTADGVAYVTSSYIQRRYPSNISKEKNSRRFETNYTSANLKECFFEIGMRRRYTSANTLRLIHVSTISSYSKGHHEILLSLKELDEEGRKFNMKFVGGGTMVSLFKDEARKLGIDQKVEFIGNVSDPSMLAENLKNADLFVFPSTTEGLPRAVIEAMATGLPCIVSDVGGNSELVSEEFIVKPRNVQELKNKIIEIGYNQKKMMDAGIRNYNFCKDNYATNIITVKRKEFYKKLKKINGE